MKHDPDQSMDATESVSLPANDGKDHWVSANRSSDTTKKEKTHPAATGSTKANETRCDVRARSQDQPAIENQVDNRERFGKYVLLKRLGQGRFSEVHLALHEKLRKKVALKRFLGAPESRSREQERFTREVRLLCQLNHPNLVRIETAGELEGQPFLVMEYVDGINLFQLVEEFGPLSVPDACQLIGQALLGVDHLKQQGLVHRDIKPSNIILTSTGAVKLVDLGMGRCCDGSDEITPEGMTVGNIYYVPPEYLDIEADPTTDGFRADIYSLGCTLFTLLSGRPPFCEADPNVAEILIAKLRRNPPSLSKLNRDVPQSLCKLVAKMMARDPKDRPSAPMGLVAMLASYADNCDLPALIRRAELLDAGKPDSEGEIKTARYLRRKVEESGELDRLRHSRGQFARPIAVATLLFMAIGFGAIYRRGFRPGSQQPVTPPTLMADDSVANQPSLESVPPSTAVAPEVEVALTAVADATIDLLEGVLPERDAFDLSVRRGNQSWQLSNLRGRGLLQLPFTIPDEYTLTFSVERLAGDGSLGIGFSVGGGRMLALLDHEQEQTLASGMYFYGADSKTQFVNRVEQPMLQTDSLVPLRLRVTTGGATLERLAPLDLQEDDQQWITVTSWKAGEANSGDNESEEGNQESPETGQASNATAPSLGPSDAYYPDALFVHVYKSAFRIDQLSLKSDTPSQVEPVFGLANSDDARLARRIVWRGGHVHIITDEGEKEVHSFTQLNRDPWLIGVTKCAGANRLMIGDAELIELSRMQGLRRLDLVYSNVTPEGVASLSGMQNLTTLSVGTPGINGSVLESLRDLPQLKTLQFIRTEVTKEQMANVSRFPNLTALCMTGSKVTDDALTEVFDALPNLRHLCLSGTQVTGKCLPDIASLSQLEELQLNYTLINDQDVDVLSDLPNLRVLGLENTEVSESAVSRFREKRPNVEIRS